MNRMTRWACTLAFLPIAACSSTPKPITALVEPAAPALASADQTFVVAAAASDAAEIQSAQLAQTKAHGARVKTFASTMVTDHTASTQKLTSIAQSKGVTVAGTPSDMAMQTQTKLQADKPRRFDRDYLDGQVAAHKAAVQVFQTEIDTGQDADLKAFALSTLPAIKGHLAMAQKLGGHG